MNVSVNPNKTINNVLKDNCRKMYFQLQTYKYNLTFKTQDENKNNGNFQVQMRENEKCNQKDNKISSFRTSVSN